MSSNPYIYAVHDPGGEHLLSGKGWVIFTEAIGCDPGDRSGRDYSQWANQGLGVIVRLNHSYGNGTLPTPDKHNAFAQRCANFVASSRGCELWIIGNEPNHRQEGAIPFDVYADGFNQAANAIKRVQADAQVIVAAVAPWNVDTGDWLFYFAQVVKLCRADGIALHTYTHDSDPNLIYAETKMQSHPDRHYEFKAYRDFLSAVPADKRHLPVYITETDQDKPWLDRNTGWVQNAYGEINWWNQQPGAQQIRCLALYRWPNHDQWGFCDKVGVHDDLRVAVQRGYQWRETTMLPTWVGYVIAPAGVNLRTEPSRTAPVIRTLVFGDEVRVHGVPLQGGEWLAVTYGAQSGYVAAAYVGQQKQAEPEIQLQTDFDRALAFVFRWEGGFSTDKNDPGNWTGGQVGVGEFKGTKYGISAGSYPQLDIANLTREQAADIYRTAYWQASGADAQPWPLSLAVFDAAVNCGVGKARQWLQQSGNDFATFNALRLEFYAKISGWTLYGNAWTRRVADLMKAAR